MIKIYLLNFLTFQSYVTPLYLRKAKSTALTRIIYKKGHYL